MARVPTSAPPNDAVVRLARSWAARYPTLATRLDRAVALVANVTWGGSPGLYFVEGSNGHQYTVRVHGRTSTCTCPDSTKGYHCKHRLAAALYVVASRYSTTAQS